MNSCNLGRDSLTADIWQGRNQSCGAFRPEKKKPFGQISEKEISKQDKEFFLKIMRLDPRDRPSAAELLQNEWFDLEYRGYRVDYRTDMLSQL
jgi:serine/threonine protein kinase